MKYPLTLLTLAVAILFMSCENNDNSISFGTVEYYPDFLWVDAKETPVNKTLNFDFSEDAKADAAVFAELQFVDNDGQPMSTDIMQVYANGQALENNILHIDNSIDSMKVTFCFNPDRAESRNYQGRLRLIRHNLDRLDSQVLSPNDQADAFVWTLKYEKRINPLAKVLIWILIIAVSCFMVWQCFLRPMLYPHFGKFKKTIFIEQEGKMITQMGYEFTGARKVVFYDRQVKQSLWQRVFVGKTKTLVNSAFKSQLTFVPKKKNAMVYGNGYVIRQNPVPRNGITEITHTQQKIKITMK